MTLNRLLQQYAISLFILLIASGLTLILPLVQSRHEAAAQSDFSIQVNSLHQQVHINGFEYSQADSAQSPSAPERPPNEVTRFYVAKSGDSPNGETWATAFTTVQGALTAAVEAGVEEIWVAAGVYTPGNDRLDSFKIYPGVRLYGGFLTGDTKLSDRDWETNLTVLSGDIDDNDTNTNGVVLTADHIRGDNSYHVVWADGTTGTPMTASTIIDGFYITAGKADDIATHYTGGGLYCDGSQSGSECSPSLRNITFSGNWAKRGGAMENGGYLGTSSPTLTNVVFSGNSAGAGGAMYNYGGGDGSTSSPTLSNVLFSGNSAIDGGAIFNYGSWDGDSRPELTNITFSGNSASDRGGAMFNDGNTDGNCNPIVRNSILWNNPAKGVTETISDTIFNYDSSIILVHSLVEASGGSSDWNLGSSYINAGGNIDEDPKFVTPVNPSTAPTSAGNLRLKTGSPAIDAGDNLFAAGLLTDLDGEVRIKDGKGDGTETVDMGAYEAPTLYKLTVTKAGTGSGKVTSSPVGIDCGETCSVLLKEDSIITLTAIPDEGSTFSGWSGDCSGTSSCVVTMTKQNAVTATFEPGLSNYLPLINR